MIVKAIIFDLDNTIYNYIEVHNKALNILFDYINNNFNLNININDNIYEIYNKKLKNNIGNNTASSHNKILTIKLLCEELLIPSNNLTKLYNV